MAFKVGFPYLASNGARQAAIVRDPTISSTSKSSILPYLKAPLDRHSRNNRQIRVLDILPRIVDDEVRCAIRIVTLDEGSQYEALSYVWGGHGLQHKVLIDGHPTSVTQSLLEALKRLRHPEVVRTLWIDQLCINQVDNEERASQVNMMREIYHNCTECIIWLGNIEENEGGFTLADARAVFDFISFAANRDGTAMRQALPVLFQENEEGESARRAWEAFSMYGNPWWTRIWTIQEAVVPRSATIIWGPFSISRDDVFEAVRNLHGEIMRDIFSERFCTQRIRHTPLLRRVLYPVRGFLHCLRGENSLNLLMRWRHRESTDPRDKVYALRGLLRSPEDIPSAASCSYDIPTTSLFENITIDQIRKENSLRPLVGSKEMPHVTLGLSSWAIDFACSNRVGKRQLKWWNHSHRYQEYRASKNQNLHMSLANGSRTLILQGALVDEVLKVAEIYKVDDTEPMNDRTIYETTYRAKRLLMQYKQYRLFNNSYINGETCRTAFYRTMTGDLIMKEFPQGRAGTKHEEDFYSLLQELRHSKSQEHLWILHFGYQRTDASPRSRIELDRERDSYLNLTSDHGGNQDPNILYESVCGMVPNHAFFITKNGYIGLGPPDTREGDQVWVFCGGNVPFVMRKKNERQFFPGKHELLLVGDAYVHGIMDGEAMGSGEDTKTAWIY